ncbi:hypothetical protein D3C87_1340350 [compost metagenome]
MQRVAVQHGQVRGIARRKRPFPVFVKAEAGAGDGEGTQRVAGGQGLARADDAARQPFLAGAGHPQGVERVIGNVVGRKRQVQSQFQHGRVRHHAVSAVRLVQIGRAAFPEEVSRNGRDQHIQRLERLQVVDARAGDVLDDPAASSQREPGIDFAQHRHHFMQLVGNDDVDAQVVLGRQPAQGPEVGGRHRLLDKT